MSDRTREQNKEELVTAAKELHHKLRRPLARLTSRCPCRIHKEQTLEVGTGQRLRVLGDLFWYPLSNHLPTSIACSWP
jgi:hypothetical protein